MYIGYNVVASPVVSDSKGNTWTALTTSSTGVSGAGLLHYAQNPTVGTGHTFTVTLTGSGAVIAVEAFSGTITSSVFDAEGPGDVQPTIASQSFPGPMTTTADNELAVTGLSWEVDAGTENAPSINESYIITDSIPAGAGYGIALAYKIIGTSGTVTDPAWSYGFNGRNVSSIAEFFSDGLSGTQPIVFVIT